MKIILLKRRFVFTFFLTFALTFVAASHLHAGPKLMHQDAYVFRVMNEVISLNDMQVDYKLLQHLKCYYPESILVVIFEDLKKNADSIGFNNLSPKDIIYNQAQKSFFAKVVQFYKLKAYTSTHQVIINPALVGGLYTVAKRSGCSLDGFISSGKFQPRFEKILKMEIFLRTRFMPDEKGPPDSDRIAKIKNSANLFMESVSKQITEEVYW